MVDWTRSHLYPGAQAEGLGIALSIVPQVRPCNSAGSVSPLLAPSYLSGQLMDRNRIDLHGLVQVRQHRALVGLVLGHRLHPA